MVHNRILIEFLIVFTFSEIVFCRFDETSQTRNQNYLTPLMGNREVAVPGIISKIEEYL